MTSPSAYQIHQRNGSGQANITIAGTFAGGGTHDIEARFNGGSWATIASASTGAFSGTLSNQAAGQGDLEVRFVDDVNRNYSISYVGIGDVFVIAGQSNAVGISSAALQTYTHATLKAGLFGNDYRWKELTDPVDTFVGQLDSVSDDGPGQPVNGSYWPLLATSIMASTSLPVAFVPCPKSATRILAWQPGADHQDRTTLYGSGVYRALQAGGIKAVLWHQGESDATVTHFTGGVAYNAYLDTFANAVMADLGVKIIAAKIHKWDGVPDTSQGNVNEINAAIVEAEGNNVNVLAGPHFDSPSRVTSALHFTTVAHMQDAAARWWAAINALAIL